MLIAAALTWVLAGLLFAILGTWGPLRKWPVVLLYLGSLAAAAYLMHTLNGQPRPVAWEFRKGEPEIIAADWIEGKTVWLLVRWEGEVDPTLYRLGWNKEMVEQIIQAEAEKAAGGTGARQAGVNQDRTGDGVAGILGALDSLVSPYHSPDVRIFPPPRRAEVPKQGETPAPRQLFPGMN